MKIAHSLSLRQAALCGGVEHYESKWVTPRHHFYGWAVSAMLAKAAYGNVHLYADEEAIRVLVGKIGIPYDSVSVCLDTAGVPTRLWVASKLRAFRRLIDEGEPFLHIDGDVFLFGRLPSAIEQGGIVTQNLEDDLCHGVHEIYTIPKRNLLMRLPKVPESWLSVSEDFAFNTGLFGGRNLAALSAYVDQTEELFYAPENAAAWRHIDSLHPFEQWSFNCTIEQHTLYAAAQAGGFPVTTLFSTDEMCSGRHVREKSYLHALGEKSNAAVPGSLTYRLERRIEKNWPELKQRIDTWLGHDPSAPAADAAVSAA